MVRLGCLPGSCPYGDSLCGFARFGPVAGNYLGMRLPQDREFFIDRTRHLPMEFFAPALEQRLIGGIPDQRMLELIGGLWRYTPNVDQFRIGRAAQGSL